MGRLGIFAYVTRSSNFADSNTIKKCIINANGEFVSCSNPITDTQSHLKLAFAKVTNGTVYGYVTDPNDNAVNQCTLGENGSFSNCLETPSPPSLDFPYGITFATALNGTQYGYVTSANSGNVRKCDLNLSGLFSACSLMGTGINAPYGIAFATFNGEQYAYIANAGDGSGPTGSIYRCPLDVSGNFNLPGCSTMISPGSGWVPYAIAFTTISGTQYAYVADNGTGSFGNIYRCTLDTNGLLVSCSTIPTVNPTWYPTDIAFATLNGNSYAYVTSASGPSSGGMFRCRVNADGTFSDCLSQSALASSQTLGIALNM